MKKEFISVFQITKTIMFEVNYYTLSDNENPYFTTSANVFVRNKRDYKQSGQCQKDVLPKGSIAKNFFFKWDKYHLNDLNNEQYEDLMKDIEDLKNAYNHIFIEKDTFRNLNSNIHFLDVVALSKLDLKKKVS